MPITFVNASVNSRVCRGSLALVAAASLALLGACSSGSNSTAASSSDSHGSGSDSAGVVAAHAATAKYEVAPTKIGISTPLKEAPPAGKTFVWLDCELSACAEIKTGIQQATQAAGWNLKLVPYKQADSASLIAAFKTALTYHPAAVALSGLPKAVWQSVESDYAKAGVPIIAGYVGPLPLDKTVIGNISGPPDGTLTGKILADWFVADSNGAGHALNVRTDDLPYLKTFNDAFAQEVAARCTGCKVTDLNTSVADAVGGKVNGAVVSSLQRDPSLNYVIATEGPFINGLPAALSAAGLQNKVKVAGENGGVENLTDVKNGTEAAFTGASLHIGGWQYVDLAIRHVEGMTFDPYDGTQPKQLLTKASSFTPTDDYDQPADYQDQFKRLWKLQS